MANPRLNPDTFYVNGAPIPASYFQGLDTAQSKGWNGDGGGSWSPITPIVVSGAGIWFCGIWSVDNGALVTTPLGSGARITFGDNDYFTSLTALSRGVLTSLASAKDVSAQTLPSSTTIAMPRFVFNDGRDSAFAVSTVGARLLGPLRVHHGAAFTSVQFAFVVLVAHSGQPTPAILPIFRVFAVDSLGNVTPLSTNAAQPGWMGQGFVQYNPRPASGLIWYNGGNTNVFTYTLDIGVVVDVTKYTYYAEIIDESGANSFIGNQYIAADCVFGGIFQLSPQ
jgi:hypothetical protein